jgi:hypothetical protein
MAGLGGVDLQGFGGKVESGSNEFQKPSKVAADESDGDSEPESRSSLSDSPHSEPGRGDKGQRSINVVKEKKRAARVLICADLSTCRLTPFHFSLGRWRNKKSWMQSLRT